MNYLGDYSCHTLNKFFVFVFFYQFINKFRIILFIYKIKLLNSISIFIISAYQNLKVWSVVTKNYFGCEEIIDCYQDPIKMHKSWKFPYGYKNIYIDIMATILVWMRVWKIKYWQATILSSYSSNQAIFIVGVHCDTSLNFLELNVLLFSKLVSVIILPIQKYIHA